MALDQQTQDEILRLKEEYSIYAPWYDTKLFKTIVEELARPFKDERIDLVLGMEARGFILGGPVAYILGCGFAVLRKGKKLYGEESDREVISTSVVDYSGKEKMLEIEKHELAIKKGDRILIVDDWFETGAQGHGAIRLVKQAGGTVAGISIMLNDMTKQVEDSYSDYNLHFLVRK